MWRWEEITMEKHHLIFTGLLILSIIALLTGKGVFVLLGLGVGTVAGLSIEYTGVRILNWWSYGGGFPIRVIVRGWGEIGVVAVLASQLFSNLGLALFLGLLFPLFAFEIPNRRVKGWTYHTKTWFVLVGWVLTIFTLQIFTLGVESLYMGYVS